jgi:multisubunit Na+/H+ antiporter MnhB subunit
MTILYIYITCVMYLIGGMYLIFLIVEFISIYIMIDIFLDHEMNTNVVNQ